MHQVYYSDQKIQFTAAWRKSKTIWMPFYLQPINGRSKVAPMTLGGNSFMQAALSQCQMGSDSPPGAPGVESRRPSTRRFYVGIGKFMRARD